MSIDLKAGYKTLDRRLDRIPQFDQRSRRFNVAPRVSSVPLRTKTHRSTVWLDQRAEGGCVSFSLHQEAGASPMAATSGLSFENVRDRYYRMQQEDPWPGGEYPGASPRYAGTSVLTGIKVMQALGYYDAYDWAFNVDDAAKAIIATGPVVFGIPWKDSMFGTRDNGTMDITGSTIGGHAIMARGVSVPSGGYVTCEFPISKRKVRIKTSVPVFRFRNTWGKDWGIDGECLLRAHQVEALMKEQGECVIPIGRRIPK